MRRDPELWHSRAADDIEAACDACLSCLAYDSCGAYADAANERAGVWAGRDRRTTTNTSRPKETSTP